MNRRQLLVLGGGGLAALAAGPGLGAGVEIIEMRGTPRGERVGFVPNGLAVAAGTTIRFTNRDPGNSHTSTAYAPEFLDRKRRIPKAAKPWDSDFLLPDHSFEVTLTVPGVYDFYCQPHEMAGMVGRIVVGKPGDASWEGPSQDTSDLMPDALTAFPAVAVILTSGRVNPKGLP